MDISDEIAYAAHDVEDSLSMGMVAIDELLYEFKISEKYSPAFEPLKKIVKECQDFAFASKSLSTSEEYSFLFRKELTSRIVNTLVNDIHVSDKNKFGVYCLCFKKFELLSEGLKKLLFKAILRKRSVQSYEKMGEKIIKGLHEVYSDLSFNKDDMLLPPEYRCNGREDERKRMIIDYIAGMMDSFALKEYKKYFGNNSLDAIYPIK